MTIGIAFIAAAGLLMLTAPRRANAEPHDQYGRPYAYPAQPAYPGYYSPYSDYYGSNQTYAPPVYGQYGHYDGGRDWKWRQHERREHEWREHERHEWREHERERDRWAGSARVLYRTRIQEALRTATRTGR